MQRPPQDADLKLQNLSRDELKKIQKSMKRPQFMGLLNEYMVEISDPKNKNEYDEYLKQMERQGQLPKHMKLAKLKPQFCFRTHIISQKNKKQEMKLFINMCSCEYLQKPSCEPGPGNDGSKGFNWQVPHSMGKIRYDQDRHKNPCQVVDCAFHPDSFKFGYSYGSFQAMMISIALQSAERLLGQRKETLSKDYVILKKLKCKGQNGQPALLPIRYIKGKAYSKGEGPAQQERDLEGKETKLQKELNEQKQEYQKGKDNKDEKEKDADEMEEEDLEDIKKPFIIEDLEKGLQTPKYTSIYTYTTDYSQFIDDPNPNSKRKARKLPSKMSLQFKVPRIQNMSEVNQLQINQTRVVMAAGEKYFIDLSFEDIKCKYPLKTNEAKAKYDKKKKTLRIEIPVDQKNLSQIIEEQPQKVEEVEKQEEETKVIENETWKNKVLDVSNQQVGVKFLQEKEQQEKEPQKKLVQEIDQDDYVEEKMEQKPEEDQSEKQANKFSVSKYYEQNKKENKEQKDEVKLLKHIFQQTNKQVILVVQMMNYQKEDVKSIYHDGELALQWNKNEQKHIVHLAISAQRKNQIAKMEIIKRVGFYAFTITKQNNQFWQKNCIIDEFAEYQLRQNQSPFEKFTQEFEKIQKAQKQAQIQLERQKEREIIQKEKEKEKEKEKQKEDIKKEQKKVNAVEQNKKQTKMQEIDEQIVEEKNKFESQIPQTSVFDKLPPQFILFDAPFIDVLN